MTAAQQAIDNNVSWCRLVCQTHGVAYSEADGVWFSHDVPPRFYPDAITAAPSRLETVTALMNERYGMSVKDSYGELSLEGNGFMRLFDAEWIELRVGGGSSARGSGATRERTSADDGEWELVRRETAYYGWSHAGGLNDVILPELMVHDNVRLFGFRNGRGYSAGFVAFRTGKVAGVSSVFAADGASVDIWAELPDLITAHWDVEYLVGYERNTQLRSALAAGFRSVGPVTVWLQDD